jgi:hypothetical protein
MSTPSLVRIVIPGMRLLAGAGEGVLSSRARFDFFADDVDEAGDVEETNVIAEDFLLFTGTVFTTWAKYVREYGGGMADIAAVLKKSRVSWVRFSAREAGPGMYASRKILCSGVPMAGLKSNSASCSS